MASQGHQISMKEAADKIQFPSETSQPADTEFGSIKDLGGDEAVLEQIGYKQVWALYLSTVRRQPRPLIETNLAV